jgi:hypothetical protein
MKHFILSMTALCLCLGLPSITRGADEPSGPSSSDKATMEKQLAEKLTHCRLIGYYQTIGQEGPPKEDEYTLNEVQKKEGDTWLFNASLQFGSKVINVPLEVPVLWAGDTPVISVTDFKLPGMGTYTARVMFYGEHYAGTWSGDKHGGYLWGRIQKLPEHEEKPAEHPAKG